MSAPVMDRPARREREPGRSPVPVRPGPAPQIRSRVRAQWLVLAAALVVLAGTLVAWALGRAADRVTVVALARPVAAGDTIDPDDLTTAQVAIDATVTGLVPPASLDVVVGRVAAIDLSAGALLTVGMWADGTGLGPDERSVGAVLSPGKFPSGLGHGSLAIALDVRAGVSVSAAGGSGADADAGSGTDASSGDPGASGVSVRVLDVTTDASDDLVITLAVPSAAADAVAAWAANDTLALIGLPDVAVGS